MNREPEYVWIIEERTYGILLHHGAYYSMVRYTRGGIDYEVLIENDEFELWEDHAIGYEQDDGE